MNLLIGWDELTCGICGKKLGRIYVSDDWGLDVQCNECEKKEIEEMNNCKHDWKQIVTNIDDLYIILECVKCKETMTVNI